jgi:hypothetical protein
VPGIKSQGDWLPALLHGHHPLSAFSSIVLLDNQLLAGISGAGTQQPIGLLNWKRIREGRSSAANASSTLMADCLDGRIVIFNKE